MTHKSSNLERKTKKYRQMKMFVTVNFLGGEYWLEKSSATNVTL